ncbi:MAG TPA: cation:proton antiporter [Verrucomicrobiae bacterium]|nr:cation:proton antiporter [Verrucomicrobiae bacterium]
MSPQQRFLLLLILVGALATVLGLVSKRARMVPYPVVLAAAGVFVGLLPGGQFGRVGADVILLAFVPGLIFEAALTLDLPELRRRLLPVGLLATAGVAVFSAVLATILSGSPSFGDATIRFVEITLGGTAIGLAVGFVGLALLRFAEDAPLEILATLVIAYGSYLAADLVHASGIVAVVVAGIVVARYGAQLGRLHGPQLLGFWSLLAFVLNAMLFIIVGAALPAWTLLPVAWLVLASFLIMLITRAVPVYGLLAVAAYRGPPIPWRWRHVTFWAGLRGALSVALALSVAGLNGVDSRVSVVAYGVVLLSLLVQGTLMAPVMRGLKIESTI